MVTVLPIFSMEFLLRTAGIIEQYWLPLRRMAVGYRWPSSTQFAYRFLLSVVRTAMQKTTFPPAAAININKYWSSTDIG
jgi:hypothetical protein